MGEKAEALEILACEFEARPRGAPSFEDLRDAVRGVHREADALVIEYDPARAAAIRELVAAERLCCATIGFDLTEEPVIALRIQAQPAQLDVFEAFLRS